MILNKVFSYTPSLNVPMQMVFINFNELYQYIKTIVEALEAMKHDSAFYTIIEGRKNILGTTEIMAPRLFSKQTCRSNIAASTPEQ